jgi:hypothetical protein
MALQTSGPISLNEIHIEAGGASGTTVSINDSDVRALIGKASGATMSFDEWYGASAGPSYLDTQTVTVGSSVSQYVTWRGYDGDTVNIGSISDGTSNLYGGATIVYLRNLNNATTQLRIQGVHSNSGWTTMTIGGVDFDRADASFSTNTDSQWTWSPTNNPFGTTDGVEVTVTWI